MSGPLFQVTNVPGGRQGLLEKLLALREIKVIDKIDQKQGNTRFVRGVAVQRRVSCGHRAALTTQDWTANEIAGATAKRRQRCSRPAMPRRPEWSPSQTESRSAELCALAGVWPRKDVGAKGA